MTVESQRTFKEDCPPLCRKLINAASSFEASPFISLLGIATRIFVCLSKPGVLPVKQFVDFTGCEIY